VGEEAVPEEEAIPVEGAVPAEEEQEVTPAVEVIQEAEEED
jgi:hypothetical protein